MLFTIVAYLSVNSDCILLSDKKNENKEVAVNDFLPAEQACEAVIQCKISFFLLKILNFHVVLEKVCICEILGLFNDWFNSRDLYASYIVESLRR